MTVVVVKVHTKSVTVKLVINFQMLSDSCYEIWLETLKTRVATAQYQKMGFSAYGKMKIDVVKSSKNITAEYGDLQPIENSIVR